MFGKLFGGVRNLGPSAFSSTFAALALNMDHALADYIKTTIENGNAWDRHGGAHWSITLEKNLRYPIQRGLLNAKPLFHAIAKTGECAVVTMNLEGGIWLDWDSPITDLSEVELAELALPPEASNEESIFYWGMCVQRQSFLRPTTIRFPGSPGQRSLR